MAENKCCVNCKITDFFTEEYIKEFGVLIYSTAEKFIKKYNLIDKVEINEAVFQKFYLDLLEDLRRLSCFHDIEYPNVIKLVAYTASWWIKRKPMQILVSDKSLIFVNECFATSLIIFNSQFCDGKSRIQESNKIAFKEDKEKVEYHLKYRNTNPQTLELFMIGTEMGCLIDIND